MEKDVVHTYSGILHSHLQGWNGAICSNTDTPRDDHTKWSKSEKERQRPHETAHMRNQKYDTNEPIYEAETESQPGEHTGGFQGAGA